MVWWLHEEHVKPGLTSSSSSPGPPSSLSSRPAWFGSIPLQTVFTGTQSVWLNICRAHSIQTVHWMQYAVCCSMESMTNLSCSLEPVNNMSRSVSGANDQHVLLCGAHEQHVLLNGANGYVLLSDVNEHVLLSGANEQHVLLSEPVTNLCCSMKPTNNVSCSVEPMSKTSCSMEPVSKAGDAHWTK